MLEYIPMSLEQNPINRDLNPIKDRLNTASVVEIADFFKKAVEERQAKYPDMRPYSVLKSVITDNLPMRVFVDMQQKAITAMGSEDEGVKTAGKNAFLFLMMKTIFKAVDFNFNEDQDVDVDREEMLSSAIISVMENTSNINQKSVISDQVSHLAQLGILSFLGEKYGILLNDELLEHLNHNPAQGILFIREIEVLRNIEGFTNKEIGNFAQELSKETGIPVDIFWDYLTHGRSLSKNTIKMIKDSEDDESKPTLEGGEIKDPADDAYEKIGSEIDMENALNTLLSGHRRKRRSRCQIRVINLKYGFDKDGIGMTNEEAGKKVGIGGAAVLKTLNQTYVRLRHPSRKENFQGYH